MPRAYTRIDVGSAMVGNDWIERRWSALLCRTVELRQKLPGGYVDWIASPCPDLRLTVDGHVLRPETIGVPEWSESCDTLGAWVTAKWPCTGWTLAVHTMALHENPAMVRTVELSNVGRMSLTVSEAAVEVLGLRRDGAGVLTDGLVRRSGTALWQTEDRTVAAELCGHGRLGLLLGLTHGGRYELFDPDPACCALVLPEPATVPPSRTVCLGRSYVMPYSGDPQQVLPGRFVELLRLLRDHAQRERERAADSP